MNTQIYTSILTDTYKLVKQTKTGYIDTAMVKVGIRIYYIQYNVLYVH